MDETTQHDVIPLLNAPPLVAKVQALATVAQELADARAGVELAQKQLDDARKDYAVTKERFTAVKSDFDVEALTVP